MVQKPPKTAKKAMALHVFGVLEAAIRSNCTSELVSGNLAFLLIPKSPARP